jgi:hypothetical protein
MQCRRGHAHIYRRGSRMHASVCAQRKPRPASARTHPSRTSLTGRPTCFRARRPQTRATRPAWTPDIDDGLHAMRGIERADEVERALLRVRAGRVRARVRGVQVREVRVRVEDLGDEGCVKRGQVLRERGVRRRCVAGAGALRRARARYGGRGRTGPSQVQGDEAWYVRARSRGPRARSMRGREPLERETE